VLATGIESSHRGKGEEKDAKGEDQAARKKKKKKIDQLCIPRSWAGKRKLTGILREELEHARPATVNKRRRKNTSGSSSPRKKKKALCDPIGSSARKKGVVKTANEDLHLRSSALRRRKEIVRQ